jgi:hypothetical protein
LHKFKLRFRSCITAAQHGAQPCPSTKFFRARRYGRAMLRFLISGHPKAKRAYAWSHLDGKNDERTWFVAVLEIPPVVSAETAVRVQIVKDVKGKNDGFSQVTLRIPIKKVLAHQYEAVDVLLRDGSIVENLAIDRNGLVLGKIVGGQDGINESPLPFKQEEIKAYRFRAGLAAAFGAAKWKPLEQTA